MEQDSERWRTESFRAWRSRTYILYPEFFAGDVVPEQLHVSAALRERLRRWNDTWQDNIDWENNDWPDPALGWRWIAEGDLLVEALQAELGSEMQVIGDFHVHSPSGKKPEGA